MDPGHTNQQLAATFKANSPESARPSPRPEVFKEPSRKTRNQVCHARELKSTPKFPLNPERRYDQASKRAAAGGTPSPAEGSLLQLICKRKLPDDIDSRSGAATPRPDGSAAMQLQSTKPGTSRQRPPEATAGEQASRSQRGVTPSPQLSPEFTSGPSKAGPALMRRSEEHAQDIQPPTSTGRSVRDSKDGEPLHRDGPLLVPLVHGEGGWAIDWDAVRFAAHPPQLTPGSTQDVFKVHLLRSLDLVRWETLEVFAVIYHHWVLLLPV